MTDLMNKKSKAKRKCFEINKHNQVNEVRFVKSVGKSLVFVACKDWDMVGASCAPYAPRSLAMAYFHKKFETMEEAKDWLYEIYNKIADKELIV